MLALQFFLCLLAYSFISWQFVVPWLRQKSKTDALMILVLPHLFRHLGVNLLVQGLSAPTLPKDFANATAIGDLITVGLAWLSLIALRLRWSYAMIFVWIFNVIGCCDLLLNILRGMSLQVANHLGAAWYVPAFVVPFMLVVHILIFVFLLRSSETRAS